MAPAAGAKRPLFLIYSALVFNLFIFSGIYIAAKFALLNMPPLVLATGRFTIAAALMYVVSSPFRRRTKIKREDWPRVLSLAVLGVPANQLLFLTGQSLTTPTHVALVYAITPATILLLSSKVGQEKISALKFVGIGMAIAGVAMVMIEKGLRLELDYLRGDAIILGGVGIWTLYTVLGKEVLGKYDSRAITSYVIILGGMLYLPFGILFSHNYAWEAVPLPIWGAIIYMAVMVSVVAYFIWYWALKQIDPSKASIIGNFQPLVTGILSWLFFSESFSPGFIAGAILVFIGVYMTIKG